MTREQLIAFIRETEEAAAQVPAAMALLHERDGMSFGDIALASLGTRKGKPTVWKRVKAYRRRTDDAPSGATSDTA